MRSISYILTGEPSCFADCIDYMSSNNLLRVTMELKSDETSNQQVLIRLLLGYFTWDFGNRVVTYHEQMGGIVLQEPVERQRLSVQNANRRLERRLADFAHYKIDVQNKEERFVYEER